MPRTAPQPGVFEAVKPDSTQSFVAVGHQGELLRTSPDYVAVTVMNEVLAGGFTSRLFGKIRTELGLAYSVGGSVNSNWTRVAPFQMQMSTRADATVKAIEALINEAKLLATTKPATDAELKLAKDSILNSFVFNNDEPSEVLGQQLAFEILRPAARLARSLPRRGREGDRRRRRARGREIHPPGSAQHRRRRSERRPRQAAVRAGDGQDARHHDSAASIGGSLGAASAAAKPGRARPAGGATGGRATASADARPRARRCWPRPSTGSAGGALDGVKSYVADGQMTVKTPQGEFTLQTKETLVMPDRFRQDRRCRWGRWRWSSPAPRRS